MKRRSQFFLVALSVFFLAAGTAQEVSPSEELHKIVDDITRIVRQYPNKQQTAKRREELFKAVSPYFDFREMAKRSLGANWKLLNPKQQEEFVDNFSRLLARTYTAKMEQAAESRIQIKRELIRGNRALLQTKVKTPSDTATISYKLIKKQDKWVVYDVAIENIGLVNNYRAEFADIIKKEGVQGLLEKIRQKAEEVGKES